jgi:hypothetical protein
VNQVAYDGKGYQREAGDEVPLYEVGGVNNRGGRGFFQHPRKNTAVDGEASGHFSDDAED